MLFVTVRRAVVLLITTGILCLSTICPAAAPADQPVETPPLPGDELLDQPAAQADLGPLDQFARDTQLASDSPILRLARVPNMFGDVFFPGGQLSVVGGGTPALMDIPLAGGSRRYKVSENNKAVPMDRYYFMYNHFHNALEADPNTAVPGLERQYSIERYIVGFERRFFDGNWSVEVRMPFCSEYGMSVPKFDVAGGDIGNLSVSLKRLLAVSTALPAALAASVAAAKSASLLAPAISSLDSCKAFSYFMVASPLMTLRSRPSLLSTPPPDGAASFLARARSFLASVRVGSNCAAV